MTQRFEPPQHRPEQTSGGIDHLPGEEPVPANQADKILRRAIELQTDESTRSVDIDRERLIRMAGELNVEPDFLLRALAEHQAGVSLDDRLDNVWQRVLAPDKVIGTRVVKGTGTRVEAAAEIWFRNQEGLRPRRHLEDGILWEKDSHPITSIRMGLRLGQGTGALRDTRGVTHRVREVKPGEQLISIEANSAGLRKTGQTLLAAGAVATVGAVGVGSAAFGGPFEPGTIALALSTLTVFTGSTILGVRMALNRLKRGINRALDAVSDSFIPRRR
ncbi:MAG: hypothetical protein OEM22_07590 [Acidimicrobiia bacterium]|nr:hypothetical protein [Acidimicrobiia bacterium]